MGIMYFEKKRCQHKVLLDNCKVKCTYFFATSNYQQLENVGIRMRKKLCIRCYKLFIQSELKSDDFANF